MAREKFEQVLGAIGHVLPGQFVLYYGCIPITHKETLMNGLAEDCYKFGAGRFVMRRGLLEEIGGELRYYGENPYFVGGPTAMALARPRLCATAGR